jgi:hypothetical protein
MGRISIGIGLLVFLVGCGTEEDRLVKVYSFDSCQVLQQRTGGGAWDSFVYRYYVSCGSSRTLVLSGRRLHGVSFKGSDDHLLVEVKSGDIDLFRNYVLRDSRQSLRVRLDDESAAD